MWKQVCVVKISCVCYRLIDISCSKCGNKLDFMKVEMATTNGSANFETYHYYCCIVMPIVMYHECGNIIMRVHT